MQDDTRPRVAQATTAFFDEVGINRLEWPACSPDANLIEHTWDMFGRCIRARQPPVQSLRDL